MADNTLQFVCERISALAEAGIVTCLFGGWAEELRGICPPRPHKDIDLLYPAGDFRALDAFIRLGQEAGEIEEVQAKRFVHKRAIVWHGILVEFLLLEPSSTGYRTNFFDTYLFEWPADTLSSQAALPSQPLPTTSVLALQQYRQRHWLVENAYLRYIEMGTARE